MDRKLVLILLVVTVAALITVQSDKTTFGKDYTAEPVDYSDISHLEEINGSLGYLAAEEGTVKDALSPFNDRQVIAVVDGTRVNMSRERMAKTFDVDIPFGPSPPPAKPYLEKNGNRSTIVSDYGNITPRYTPVVRSHLFNVNGSIAYSTVQNESMFYIVNGTPQTGFKNIYEPTVIDGKLAYGAIETHDGKNYANVSYIIYDGNRIKGKGVMRGPTEVNGGLAYKEYINDTGVVLHEGKRYGRFLGDKLGEKYFRIRHLEGIKGKPFFSGENNENFFHYHGNKSIGPFQEPALYPVVIDKQIIFDAKIDGKESIVRWDVN